ncbi:MAG: NAD(P)-binding protein [Ilumatobacteraceae bacterium]
MAGARQVVVVGGGVGGLATAIRLRVRGHDVTVHERHAVPGGKVAVLERDGFLFDVGPSLVTLPHVYDELFRVAGTTLADEVDLVRLDPQFRYRWPSGRSLDVTDAGCDVLGWAEFVAGPHDLGGQRAHVLRRADERAVVARPPDASSSRPARHRSVAHSARRGRVGVR